MEKKTIHIKQIKADEMNLLDDVVISEYPFTIYVNQKEIITLLCTPKDLKQLAYGFLYSEGFIQTKEDVENCLLDNKNGLIRFTLNKDIDLIQKMQGKRVRTTGCGKGSILYSTIDHLKSKKIESDFTITSKRILNLSRELNKKSTLFLETGGVHSTMLINNNDVISFYEDVARHNTIDKIIGDGLLKAIDFTHAALFTTGRISSEMLLKALKAKIPMIMSRSAPTDLAVKLAKEYDITLIGFIRGDRMNVYHDVNRIIIK